MDPHVSPQAGTSREHLVAHGTGKLVRVFASVEAQMRVEAALLGERFAADVTGERLLACVD